MSEGREREGRKKEARGREKEDAVEKKPEANGHFPHAMPGRRLRLIVNRTWEKRARQAVPAPAPLEAGGRIDGREENGERTCGRVGAWRVPPAR